VVLLASAGEVGVTRTGKTVRLVEALNLTAGGNKTTAGMDTTLQQLTPTHRSWLLLLAVLWICSDLRTVAPRLFPPRA